MDWAQIIVVLLSIMLGILVIAAIGLVVSFLLLTHKIRQTSSDIRSLAQNAAKLMKAVRTIAAAAGGVKMVIKTIKQKKGAISGQRNKDAKRGK